MDTGSWIFIGGFVLIAVYLYMDKQRRAEHAKEDMAKALAAWAVNPMNPQNPLGYLFVGGVNFDQVKYNAYLEELAAAAAEEE